jgi:excisionase family DNA binding protein
MKAVRKITAPESSAGGVSASSLKTMASRRISVEEIARGLNIGRLAVYDMLERGIIPAIRLGRRWIITRHAYEQWERTCGIQAGTGLVPQPEVTVLN